MTDTYVNIFEALPQMTAVTVLSVFFMTLARLLPILTLVPFLGAKNLPMTVRMMFAISLTAIFLPQNLLTVTTQLPFDVTLIGFIIKELLIGLCIALFAATPFFIASMSGTLIDHSRGSSSLQVNDPTTQTQASPIGLVYNYVLIALFYSLGGPFLFLNGVADSYVLLPIDKLFNADFFDMNLGFWKQAFHLAEYIFDLAIQLAAPALIGVLLTDMFLGIANRLAPQVQIVFLGMSLKSWVGLALMTVAWILIIQVMAKEAINFTKAMNLLYNQAAFFIRK